MHHDYDFLIGRTIINVREMTKEELDEMDWYGSATVLVLDDGTEIVPSRDPEGNGPGTLFIDNPTITN